VGYAIDSHEIQRLLEADWETRGGAIYVRDDLSPAEAERSRLFRNARSVLGALVESGGTKATTGGNLNREFVGEMLERLDLELGSVEAIRAVNKVINEMDAWTLHLTRVVVQLAGLIRLHRGKFQVVQKRSHLMEEEHASALYRLLFLSFFRKLNLAYLDSMAEVPALQQTMPVSLFMVSRLMDDWVLVEDIADYLFLAQVRERMPYYVHFDSTPRIAGSRIIRPLLRFGLLEERPREGMRTGAEVRKSNLFDRALEFNVQMTPVLRYLR